MKTLNLSFDPISKYYIPCKIIGLKFLIANVVQFFLQCSAMFIFWNILKCIFMENYILCRVNLIKTKFQNLKHFVFSAYIFHEIYFGIRFPIFCATYLQIFWPLQRKSWNVKCHPINLEHADCPHNIRVGQGIFSGKLSKNCSRSGKWIIHHLH